ncbi:MAG: chemotaxis response regulator protein-glutamate methylesterase [Gammaproteobacteria bacterium]
MSKKKVLIVDDSQAVCRFLEMVLGQEPTLEVVGYALDPFEAREKIKQTNPDVLTLDVEMPRMDGITFLRNLMRLHPMPVVMLSSLTTAGAEVTLDALDIGAVDFAVKRHPKTTEEMEDYANDIRERVRNAAASVAAVTSPLSSSAVSSKNFSTLTQKIRQSPPASQSVHRVVAIGASTGGPGAILELVEGLDLRSSCAVLSQHMPQHFMEPFAHRIALAGGCEARIAIDGETLKPGIIYVAPGDRHLTFLRAAGELCAAIDDGPACNDHRPSVDVMFDSVAKVVGASAVGVILTGMGRDGADGLARMRGAGALTIAQDEATSVVWGMPGSAVRVDGADGVLPLGEIQDCLHAAVLPSSQMIAVAG